jgi:hypothetical protein
VTAALASGFVGWLLHIALGVELLRLVVPLEPPHTFYQAMITALVIEVLSGTITTLPGAAIHRAKVSQFMLLSGSRLADRQWTFVMAAAKGWSNARYAHTPPPDKPSDVFLLPTAAGSRCRVG